ncbi:MAG: hypothetical protein CSA34_04495 [Desulfobulbus propionicus]|nr:MAG: hypothetical protein CSA34_04495 [Desulfobulbus propionicus]
MRRSAPRIFFDNNDYHLLEIVDDVLERGARSRTFRSLLMEYMHPHGIKEMAAPRGLRIAYAVVSLLGSFEKGGAHDRLKALRSLRDEVLFSSTTYYRKNTARVLLQIMKELVRTRDNEIRRLKLAHDFRVVSTGNPRVIRKELAKYHLVEMPEEWNQLAFDNHVHDANTKGRKSPTHLIMDAWIKGIRSLTVVYYNYVRPDVIEELLEAGKILDINVQVGIEISTRFRDKYIRFTWEPNGFPDNSTFLQFLDKKAVMRFMKRGREVSRYQQQYVFDVFDAFNQTHRQTLNQELGISLAPLARKDFLVLVGKGQPSILHLARFIYNAIADHIAHLSKQEDEHPDKVNEEKMRGMTVESIIADYLLPFRNPGVHDPTVPQEGADIPVLLNNGVHELLTQLLTLHPSSHFTLNLGNLSAQDTLEILYAGRGMFTHIEAYNLKDASHGMSAGVTVGVAAIPGEAVQLKSPESHYRLVSNLQKALNDDNVISLKNAIREIILDLDEDVLRVKSRLEKLPAEKEETAALADEISRMQERKLQLIDILSDLETLHNSYRKRTLKSRIGSGSTGQAEHRYGMGFVVLDTLPARARKAFHEKKNHEGKTLIPVSAQITKNSHTRVRLTPAITARGFTRTRALKRKRWTNWTLDSVILHAGIPGNIGTLGGLAKQFDNGIAIKSRQNQESISEPWKYLTTNVKNTVKVLLGFFPAFLTFFLTKDWWLLAYFGAVIWFGITGSRNIIQSVLGGGGLRRSPFLPWNSLVSWSRIADSLLYTGFSVPLLDYLVKTLLLDRAMGVTTATNPMLLYTIMGLANGIYISSHNVIRGLPRGASIGNFFRSILAIPVAILLNTVIGVFLGGLGIPDVTGTLQKWAAIISKFASDCVAAVIEGLADRQTNITARLQEYHTKLSQVFSVFSRLDLLFPEEDVLALLQSPKMMMKTLSQEAKNIEQLVIVNALDLMYFWMYQPRAQKALALLVQDMSEEEWLIFHRSQLILTRHREISQAVVDGLIGNQFSKALAFYLDRSNQYMDDMEQLKKKSDQLASVQQKNEKSHP